MTASASTWRYGWWIWNHYYLRRFMKVICIWKSSVTYSLYIMIISTGLLDFPCLQFVFWIFMFFLFSGKRERQFTLRLRFKQNAFVLGVSMHLDWVHAMRDTWAVIGSPNGKLFYGRENYLMISLAFGDLMIAMQESKLQHLQHL